MQKSIARMAGVTEVSLSRANPRRAFFFEPHRLALPCWALGGTGKPALLLTFDRHFDLVAPVHCPAPGQTALELDAFARQHLDIRNYDHILAAMEAGVVSDVICVARAWPQGAFRQSTYVDARGEAHSILALRTLDDVIEAFGHQRSNSLGAEAKSLLEQSDSVLLDFDLDCFTSPSDVNPTQVVPWTAALIRSHLETAAKPFWDAVLQKTGVVTCALEPAHCGGLVAAHDLFKTFAHVFFVELLQTDLP